VATGISESAHPAERGRAKRSLSRFGLRNWRVRWRLTALILVPTVVCVALGGARVVGSVQSIDAYDRTTQAAAQAEHLRSLVQALGLERDTGGWLDASRGLRRKLAKPYAERKAAVDTLVKTVRADLDTMDESYGPRVLDVVRRARLDLEQLSRTRGEGQRDTTRYDSLLDTLLRLHDELSLVSDDSQIIGDFRALSALARAKEQVSRQRVQLLRGYYNSASVDAKEVERFIASSAAQRAEIATVGQEAGPQVGMALQRALTRPEYFNTELTKSRAITLASGKAPGVRLRQDLLASTDPRKISAPDQWFNDNAATIAALQSVERSIGNKVALRGQELRDGETRTAVIAAILILALLMLVLLLTVAIARSMVTPLRRLRTEALEVAGFRLPDVVRQLRLSGDTVPEVRPIDVDGNDEIGEVARAFDQVHRQAVRLAGEEAELRSNISSMFVNLSRRTQTLVERQISLIDGLEKGEQDGARLADLFKLDHLATRMRRNSENLLVLAGHEPARRRSQPAKLVDVVRASLSEVEGYERVQVKVHRTTSVLGSAANDLVHLVAELVENALQFSPSNTQVVVTSSLVDGGGALVSVTDTGIGMTEEELAEANRRLAEPPVVDVSVSRRMGLFVVGRLALRHGVRVQLRRGGSSGLVAMVMLPPVLIADGVQKPLPQRPAFGGSAPAPQGGPGVPVQNGTFRSFNSLDSFGAPGAAGAPAAPGFGAPNPGVPGAAGAGANGAGRTGPNGPNGPNGVNGLNGGGANGAGDAGGPAVNGGGPARNGTSRFSADTDGGAFRQPSVDTGGGYPSYPSPSVPANERPGFPSYPSTDSGSGAFQTPPPASPPVSSASYSTADVRRPDPHPSVDVSPMDSGDEFLPIFASVESAWFRRPPAESPAESPAAVPAAEKADPGEQRSAQAVPSGEETWRTAADAGWRAAAAASDPSLGGITAAGLPKRTPKANLVPGTAGASTAQGQPQRQPQRQAPVSPVSAERMRNRMSSFQQGVRRGRAEVREQEERE
jgi:signal transduction histidine kinase